MAVQAATQAISQQQHHHHQLQQRQDQEVLDQQLEQHQRRDSLASLSASLPPINTSMPKAAQAGDPSPDRHGVRHEDVLISLPGPPSADRIALTDLRAYFPELSHHLRQVVSSRTTDVTVCHQAS